MQVRITKDGKRLKVDPVGFLGRDAFGLYLAACRRANGRYSKEQKSQMVPRANLESLLGALADAGFEITGDDSIEADITTITQSKANASERNAIEFAAREEVLSKRGMALHPFQRDGVRMLMANRRFLLADQMGLGKTPQALMALPSNASVVCVAPAAVKGVWLREAGKWRGDLRTTVLSGRNSFRWPEPGEMVILNWDILPDCDEQKVGRYKRSVLPDVLLKRIPKHVYVIGDEAHAIKNRTALRTQRFGAISRAVRDNDGAVWLLTGTPLLNRPPELWQVLCGADLARDAFGSWNTFVDMMGGKPGAWGGFEWAPPDQIDSRVPDMLRRVSLQRRRREVLPDLPDKSYSDITVNGIDQDTRDKCDRLIELLLGEGIDLVGASERVDLTKLAGVTFKEMSEVRSCLATSKIPAMIDLIDQYEQQDEPVIVFSYHRAPIDTLAQRKGWEVITGDVSNDERTAIEDRFQRGELVGLGLTIGAGGTGLTLTHAAHALFVDLAWTPALNEQAEDRICRIGQTRGCVITRMHADHPLDIRVNQLLMSKQALIAATVEASARATVTDDDINPAPLPITFRRESMDGCDRDRDEDDAPQRSTNGSYSKRREAENDLERWASSGIIAVAGMDPDHAAAINGVGFSKFDGKFGHSLADQVGRSGKLTDKQWNAAVKLARKYRRQIGAPPDATT